MSRKGLDYSKWDHIEVSLFIDVTVTEINVVFSDCVVLSIYNSHDRHLRRSASSTQSSYCYRDCRHTGLVG